MAEFPETGRHCSLKICNKLDFAPFQCKFCDNFFCGLHRFEHGCNSANSSAATDASESSQSAKRQFLCSFSGCFAHEFVKIECSHCQNFFCLSHRQCENHNCKSLEKANTITKTSVNLFTSTSSMAENSRNNENTSTSTNFNTKPKIPLTAEQKARAERVAVIQLKMKNPLRISAEEQLFLFVVIGDDGCGEENSTKDENLPRTERMAVMISRFWSIGRAVDSIVKQLNLVSKNNEFLNFQRWIAIKKCGENEANLLASDDVAKHFADREEILLRLVQR